jgi:hypothetical protein
VNKSAVIEIPREEIVKATHRYEKPCVVHDGVVEFIFDSISGLSSSDYFTFDDERCTDG